MDSFLNSITVFRHRGFALLWVGRFLTNIATFIQSIAVGWQVYTVARLTHGVEESSFLVGMVGLAQFLPMFALVLLAGAMADRHDRRKILLATGALQIVCAAGFSWLALSPHPSLVLLFIVAGFFGVARAFSSPAGVAIVPTLVPAEIRTNAVAWNTLSMQGGMVLGPWLGGLLCAVSPFWANATAGAFYVVAWTTGFPLLRMTLLESARSKAMSRYAMIKEGLSYLWTSKIVLGAISLDLVAVMLGGVTALLPVYARDVLAIGADGFGLLRSGPAIGAGLVTLVMTVKPIQRHAGTWMLISVVIYGIATCIFAVSRNITLSMAMLILLGGADSFSVFIRQSLVQIVTPDGIRGRVSAVERLFVSASNELGEFESGTVARFLGPVGSALFGGIGSIVVTLLWARLFPALRKADRLVETEM
jgi:MFS family permease